MPTAETSAQRPRKERKENADIRRSQLLEATRRSIVANGLSKTTLATVAAEAGLSQGVAVFYYKSKAGLLAETLRDQYARYEANWTQALANADDDALSQVIAMIKSDFDPTISDSNNLAVWYAFWGELKVTPQFGEISSQFDSNRRNIMRDIFNRLLADNAPLESDQISDWIENLTDGYWQKLHLFPESTTRARGVEATLRMLAQLLPRYADLIKAS